MNENTKTTLFTRLWFNYQLIILSKICIHVTTTRIMSVIEMSCIFIVLMKKLSVYVENCVFIHSVIEISRSVAYHSWLKWSCFCIYRYWREEEQSAKKRKQKPSLLKVILRVFGFNLMLYGICFAIMELGMK